MIPLLVPSTAARTLLGGSLLPPLPRPQRCPETRQKAPALLACYAEGLRTSRV